MALSRRAAERGCKVRSQLNLQSPRVPGQLHHQAYYYAQSHKQANDWILLLDVRNVRRLCEGHHQKYI